MDHLLPQLLNCACTLRVSLARLAAAFDNTSTAATAVVAKLDPQIWIRPQESRVSVTCVKNLYTANYIIMLRCHCVLLR